MANSHQTPTLFSRREILRYAIAGGTLAVLPVPLRPRRAMAEAPRLFLDSPGYALVEAITARIIPTDTLPGAREAGVVDYIQGLLSAIPAADSNCDRRSSAADLVALTQQLSGTEPICRAADADGDGALSPADLPQTAAAIFESRPIFAGGPFSGRTPYGDFEHGRAADQFPGNSFQSVIPLNRLQRLAWTVRLDGADSVAEVGANPLARSLSYVDLRHRYRLGLAAIDEASHARFGLSFVDLTDAQQDQILSASDSAFVDLITAHTVEGMFCAPEYGGNRDRIGWQLIGFDGDSQPLGYTLGFDEQTQAYVERPDKPCSRPDPDESCAGFSASVVRFLGVISLTEETQPAMRFRSPFCFDVE